MRRQSKKKSLWKRVLKLWSTYTMLRRAPFVLAFTLVGALVRFLLGRRRSAAATA